jgi:hypothetical protein
VLWSALIARSGICSPNRTFANAADQTALVAAKSHLAKVPSTSTDADFEKMFRQFAFADFICRQNRMVNESSFFGEAYQIDSVKPSEAPQGMQGIDWHCYVIVQGINSIRGYRQGSHPVVMRAVEEIVNQLNERRFGKRWRGDRVVPS